MNKKKNIDSSLENNQQTPEQMLVNTSAEEQMLLHQRAVAYAEESDANDEQSDDFLIVLTFLIGNESYGVDASVVRAVRVLPKITPVPGTPSFYRGVVNLRGQITTILDLRDFFNINEQDNEDYKEIVVVNANALEMGLLVRHVMDVIRIPRSTLQPFDHFKYTLGITADKLVVLDIPQLFEDERLVIGTPDE